LKRRIENAGFASARDPRDAARVDIPLRAILTALVTGMTTLAGSLRAVERRTEQIAGNQALLGDRPWEASTGS
jgi:hypothetical protein